MVPWGSIAPHRSSYCWLNSTRQRKGKRSLEMPLPSGYCFLKVFLLVTLKACFGKAFRRHFCKPKNIPAKACSTNLNLSQGWQQCRNVHNWFKNAGKIHLLVTFFSSLPAKGSSSLSVIWAAATISSEGFSDPQSWNVFCHTSLMTHSLDRNKQSCLQPIGHEIIL